MSVLFLLFSSVSSSSCSYCSYCCYCSKFSNEKKKNVEPLVLLSSSLMLDRVENRDGSRQDEKDSSGLVNYKFIKSVGVLDGGISINIISTTSSITTTTTTINKIMPRTITRRGFQALVLVLVTVYATVLIYQAVLSPPVISPVMSHQQWPEENLIGLTNGHSVNFPVQRLIDVEETTVTPSLATVTTTSLSTNLNDLFISVKTTRHYHHSRLPAIITTWFQDAKDQTWFFTDRDDPHFQNLTNGHMINTKCSSSHNRRALCCKMSVELDTFLESGKKWFCHFDDDNYVNVPRLLRLLDNYNPRKDWYLGRPSIPAPLEIMRQHGSLAEPSKRFRKVKFWFATGGAGFCISRALALKMVPVAGGGKFITVGDRIRLPDDVTMGYIIEHLLKKQLTVVEQFHSHLEPMKFLNNDTFHEQISFSYSKGPRVEWNIVKIDGFDLKDDPNRFRSIHCRLFRQTEINCPHR
ncbi:fringe glycosyltransferase [Microplitis mediator]|uniref:fringe glycosyltransferase n=1 Tax=Microplitis mediator TaxID=375433 RepID=UPI00255315FF|nr:fringe glycosyltransferase [Microplitis mediator]